MTTKKEMLRMLDKKVFAHCTCVHCKDELTILREAREFIDENYPKPKKKPTHITDGAAKEWRGNDL